MLPVIANMGLVLQFAGILIAFPIAMGFAYDETQAIISLLLTSFAFFFLSVGIVSVALAVHLKLALIALMVIGRVEIFPFLIAVTKVKG